MQRDRGAALSGGREYSWLDRALHRLAFSSPAVQLTAADIECALYGRRLREIGIESPVFLTSLPRAGTTLMLEALGALPQFATYRYRDMPFVLAPLLWEACSKGFRKPARLKERAHGDGMAVGYDSPEAFEEVLWRAFWPEKFTADGIELWGANEDADEFRDALTSQMQRIIAVRSNGSSGHRRRYLSKNNANIARLGLLRRLFPSAVLLVPFRNPMTQAASLLRQHLRFTDMHREDPFAKTYMHDIGHLEFGALHRPLRFEGLDRMASTYRATTLDYWLAYWVLAFTHILRHREHVLLVSFERLCRSGVDGFRAIAARLGIPADAVQRFGGSESRATSGAVDEATIDASLRDRAHALHGELLAASIV